MSEEPLFAAMQGY